MRRLARIQLTSAVVLAAGISALGSSAVVPSIPAIYITYTSDCNFTMMVDPGTPITAAAPPGPTLPPGVYQVAVWMPNPGEGYACGRPRFTLTGPGVSSVTDFKGQELEDDHVLPPLQPSSTYLAVDENAPGGTRRFFTTSASGSSSSLLGPTPGTQGGALKGSAQVDIVGSQTILYRGKLLATVGASGQAALKRHGKNVAVLKAGRYDIQVVDADRRAGFFLQRRTWKAVTVTSLPFVGTRTRHVTLAAGKWTFFSKLGKPTAFTVAA